jgi:hypothetical protein
MRTDKETDALGENPLQGHFIRHESHMTWSRTAPGQLRLNTGG